MGVVHRDAVIDAVAVAGRIGAWLCDRSAELAIFHGGSTEQTLLPRDFLDNLDRAFAELEIGSAL